MPNIQRILDSSLNEDPSISQYVYIEEQQQQKNNADDDQGEESKTEDKFMIWRIKQKL